MTGKPNAYLKSMVTDLPQTSKLRIMIEGNQDLEEIVRQVLFVKQCLYSFGEEFENGETGKELLYKFGYFKKPKEADLEDRQKMFGFMTQIESVAKDLAEINDD